MRDSTPIFPRDAEFYVTVTSHEPSTQIYTVTDTVMYPSTKTYIHAPTRNSNIYPALSIRHSQDSLTTHASTQHMKMNPLAGPTYGIFCKANDTTTVVKIMTTLYTEVAIAVTIPLYVTGCAAVWAPCCRAYVRLAMISHHVLCQISDI